jgi:hypothetical protein
MVLATVVIALTPSPSTESKSSTGFPKFESYQVALSSL